MPKTKWIDFILEIVDFSGPDISSTIKKLILVEGQIFDFRGDFMGEASRTLTFLQSFLNNFDFSQ